MNNLKKFVVCSSALLVLAPVVLPSSNQVQAAETPTTKENTVTNVNYQAPDELLNFDEINKKGKDEPTKAHARPEPGDDMFMGRVYMTPREVKNAYNVSKKGDYVKYIFTTILLAKSPWSSRLLGAAGVAKTDKNKEQLTKAYLNGTGMYVTTRKTGDWRYATTIFKAGS